MTLLLDGFIVNDFFDSLSQDVNQVPKALFPGFGGEGKAPCGRGCQNVFLAAVQPRVILFYEAELNVTIEYTEATILQFSRLSFAVAHNENKVA